MERVSACVLSWRRPHNLPAIVAELGRHSFVDEILIWANDPAVPLDFTDARVRVLSSRENVGCYGRYLCAEQARNRIVYVQDDDCLLANMDELAAVFRRDPTRIAHALRAGHFAERHLQVHGDCQVALVGWGAFMLRDWTSVLDRVPASLRAGVLFRREADRFFSVLPSASTGRSSGTSGCWTGTRGPEWRCGWSPTIGGWPLTPCARRCAWCGSGARRAHPHPGTWSSRPEATRPPWPSPSSPSQGTSPLRAHGRRDGRSGAQPGHPRAPRRARHLSACRGPVRPPRLREAGAVLAAGTSPIPMPS